MSTDRYPILELYKTMNKTCRLLKDAEAREDYYEIQRDLKGTLLLMLRENFLLLTKLQLVRFLVLCNSHRPMEPVAILTRLSMAYEELGL